MPAGFDRQLQCCPVRWRRSGGRGSQSSVGFRRRGVISRAILTVPDANIICRSGYHRVYGKTTNRASEASALRTQPLNGWMERRGLRTEPVDFVIPSGRCGLNAFEDRLLLLFCFLRRQGYSTVPKDSKIGTGTWEPQASTCHGRQAIRGDRGRMFGGAEFS